MPIKIKPSLKHAPKPPPTKSKETLNMPPSFLNLFKLFKSGNIDGCIQCIRKMGKSELDTTFENNSNSLLISATNFGSKPVVEVLLQLGANQVTRDKNGFTPLQIACNKNEIEMASLFLSYIKYEIYPSCICDIITSTGNENTILKLIQHQLINAPNDEWLEYIHTNSNSCLHLIAIHCLSDVMKYLLHNHGNCEYLLTVTNDKGHTPIQITERLLSNFKKEKFKFRCFFIY